MDECNLCGGQVAVLGALGRRVHGRCVQCGMDQSFELTDEELERMNEESDEDE
jgi:hypothetical protein